MFKWTELLDFQEGHSKWGHSDWTPFLTIFLCSYLVNFGFVMYLLHISRTFSIDKVVEGG